MIYDDLWDDVMDFCFCASIEISECTKWQCEQLKKDIYVNKASINFKIFVLTLVNEMRRNG